MTWLRSLVRGRGAPGLIPFGDALDALGYDGVMGRRQEDVPLSSVVGSMSRPGDFDQDFRLVNRSLQDCWRRLAGEVRAGLETPPVDLVQLGELYFVVDGHHRVSVARSMGRASIPASILRVCTIAYAMCCLRAAHLPSKAAERQFLERVPLPAAVRDTLWLDRPADWMRLADDAEAWGFRRAMEARPLTDRAELAQAWWTAQVTPEVERLRASGAGQDLRDVQVYATALAARDRLGRLDWAPDLADEL
ncbi:MAG: hypothetical protein GEU96_09150 [Propionibacteriales bacterium]|nr:hypothetical protein [Propionibacteriales bacterium]